MVIWGTLDWGPSFHLYSFTVLLSREELRRLFFFFLTVNRIKTLSCSRPPIGFLLPIKWNANSSPSLARTLWLDLRVTALGNCRDYQSYCVPCRQRLCLQVPYHIFQLPSPSDLQPHQPSFWSSNLSSLLLYHRAFAPAATPGWSILHLNFEWLAPCHSYLHCGLMSPERISSQSNLTYQPNPSESHHLIGIPLFDSSLPYLPASSRKMRRVGTPVVSFIHEPQVPRTEPGTREAYSNTN